MTRKTFPIPATCSKCGHADDIFVDDEMAAKAVKEYAKDRVLAFWRPLLVRRMIISWVVAAAIGFVLGRWAR